MCAATSGAVVGAVVPPARSTVAATTAPLGTVPFRCTTLVPPPAKSPAGRARPPAGMTHASYVFPCGAREARDGECRLAIGAEDDDRAHRFRLRRAAGAPDAEPDGRARGDRGSRGGGAERPRPPWEGHDVRAL